MAGVSQAARDAAVRRASLSPSVLGAAVIGATVPIKGTSTAPPLKVRGLVRLWSQEAGLTATLQHDKPAEVLQERAGGFREVPRQGALPTLTFDGSPLLRIQLNLILDGKTRARPVSVEEDLRRVRKLGVKIASLKRPPTMRVVGTVPFADGGTLDEFANRAPLWVYDSLTVKEQSHLRPSGACCKALVTIVLKEWNDDDVEATTVKALGFGNYRWEKGDTLPQVAKDLLGSDLRAQWLRDANPAQTKKGWSKVEVGTKIRYPKLPQAAR